MTEKKDPPSNVKSIRKGITINTTEPPIIVNQDVVDSVKALLYGAEKGYVTGLVYTTSNIDSTADYDIVGEFGVPDRTQNMLKLLNEDYWELMTRPMLTGEGFDIEE